MAVHEKRVLKDQVLIDDSWQELVIGQGVVHVGQQDPLSVTVWWEQGIFTIAREFRVFGTGHPVPDYASHVGSVQSVSGLVWHLYEREVSA